jgi:hypothetical protein
MPARVILLKTLAFNALRDFGGARVPSFVAL